VKDYLWERPDYHGLDRADVLAALDES